MTTQRKELKELTLKEKVDLLNFLENSSQRKTAEHFGVSKTTVSNIKKRKDEYFERYSKENGGLQRKRKKTSLDEVNEATLCWFKQMRAVNARISGPMIQEIAKKFAQEFGVEDFQASSGWLEKFKLRHKISQKVLCGESNEVPAEVVEELITKFPDFARGFKDDDLFNADECGLFFKAMPDRSLVMKGDKCKSGTYNEPDPETIFQAILSEVQPSREVKDAPGEVEEENEDDMDAEIPKEGDVGHLIKQLKSYAVNKCPSMLNGIASIDSAFSSYLYTKKKQTRIDSLLKKE